jgi:hypothetical protein
VGGRTPRPDHGGGLAGARRRAGGDPARHARPVRRPLPVLRGAGSARGCARVDGPRRRADEARPRRPVGGGVCDAARHGRRGRRRRRRAVAADLRHRRREPLPRAQSLDCTCAGRRARDRIGARRGRAERGHTHGRSRPAGLRHGRLRAAAAPESPPQAVRGRGARPDRRPRAADPGGRRAGSRAGRLAGGGRMGRSEPDGERAPVAACARARDRVGHCRPVFPPRACARRGRGRPSRRDDQPSRAQAPADVVRRRTRRRRSAGRGRPRAVARRRQPGPGHGAGAGRGAAHLQHARLGAARAAAAGVLPALVRRARPAARAGGLALRLGHLRPRGGCCRGRRREENRRRPGRRGGEHSLRAHGRRAGLDRARPHAASDRRLTTPRTRLGTPRAPRTWRLGARSSRRARRAARAAMPGGA